MRRAHGSGFRPSGRQASTRGAAAVLEIRAGGFVLGRVTDKALPLIIGARSKTALLLVYVFFLLGNTVRGPVRSSDLGAM